MVQITIQKPPAHDISHGEKRSIYRIMQAWPSFRQCQNLPSVLGTTSSQHNLASNWGHILLLSLISSQWAAISQLGGFCHARNEDTHWATTDQAQKEEFNQFPPKHKAPVHVCQQMGSVESGLSSPLHFSLNFSKESLCFKWTFWTSEIECPRSSIWMILFEEILLLGGWDWSELGWDPC